VRGHFNAALVGEQTLKLYGEIAGRRDNEPAAGQN
jgi:hypothetical protein